MRIAVLVDRWFLDDDRISTWFHSYYMAVDTYLIRDNHKLLKTLLKNVNADMIVFRLIHLMDPKSVFTPRYFFIRDRQIIDNCDLAIFFSDDPLIKRSELVKYAEKRGKTVEIR